MGVWRVQNGLRFVAYNGTAWDADLVTALALTLTRLNRQAEVEPGRPAGWYAPKGANDELGIFLHAKALIPTPHTITGDPPAEPARVRVT